MFSVVSAVEILNDKYCIARAAALWISLGFFGCFLVSLNVDEKIFLHYYFTAII
jgi:hypothetical protein